MRPLEEANPAVIALYYLGAIGIPMLIGNPILIGMGLVGALSHSLLRLQGKAGEGGRYLIGLLLFVLLTVINPLVSHNGTTVLFVLSDAPITFEATVYGAIGAGGIVTSLLLLHTFSEIMTRDKLLYVFGTLSPRLAALLSMGLRYIPLLGQRARRITDSQRALGRYSDDTFLGKLRGDLRVFSILLTWALENGITTADSMAARGYGKGKRTHFSRFRFTATDVVLLTVLLVCSAAVLIAAALGALRFSCYPTLSLAPLSPLGTAAYLAYGILIALPTWMETEERLKWNFLQSRISASPIRSATPRQ